LIFEVFTFDLCGKSPFGFATTVHKDVTERLRAQNRTIFEQVREVLDKNKAERHMRGGEATKQKYILQKARLG
jgi:sporulation transcriptional regulator SpoIIID